MKRKKEGPTTLHTKVSGELYDKLAARAEKERRTVHNMVLFLLEENVDKK